MRVKVPSLQLENIKKQKDLYAQEQTEQITESNVEANTMESNTVESNAVEINTTGSNAVGDDGDVCAKKKAATKKKKKKKKCATSTSGGAPSRSSNPQARKRRKIPKLVLNADNLVGLLRKNNGKMLAKVLLRRFENMKEQIDYLKELRDQFCVVEKVEHTKPDGKKEIINYVALKKNN